MASELVLRDTSRHYLVPGASVSVHVTLVRVLMDVSDCLARAGSASMRCTCLRFSTQRLPAAKFTELDRQLAGQQAGLNTLTVAEYLAARAGFDPRERDPQVARRARTSWRGKLARMQCETLQQEGVGDAEAWQRAGELADRQMRSLHALHNPDRIAGGHDVIADFGDGQVNSTIGRQWNHARRGETSRVRQLDAAATEVPEQIRGVTRMNGLLLREQPAPPVDDDRPSPGG